jgi:hypothetical protein
MRGNHAREKICKAFLQASLRYFVIPRYGAALPNSAVS